MSLLDLNDGVIAQVRGAADIVDFIGQVTPLKLAGKSYKGLCPFHREKTPSFTVDRTKGLFYCFGCGTGGDVFKFLTLTERFTFPEAVEYVAGRVGIELPRRKKTSRDADKDDLLDVIDDASLAFHQALGFPDNAAMRYLRERRVPKEIIDKYGFGYAPDSWDYIVTRLARKYGEKKLELAGLVTPRKTGSGYYDRFRNRLMIPIHRETGALVGFGGRSLDGSDPKYLNSPESELFNKSRLLYNLHRSKDFMRRIDRAILVEGYFDAIALDHAGIPGVVASMGTSFTAGQASLLRKFASVVVISLDADPAGRSAVLRAAPVLLSGGLAVRLFVLTEKDPDIFIQKHGGGAFLEAVSNSKDIFQFALEEWAPHPRQMSAAERSEVLQRLEPLLQAPIDTVHRNVAANEIADHLGLTFETVWQRVRGKSPAPRAQEREARPSGATAEKKILALALQGKLSGSAVGRLREELFEEPACKTLFSIIKNDVQAGNPIDFTEIATQLRGEAELTLLSELSLTEDFDDAVLGRLEETLQPLERRYIDHRLMQIQRDIHDAEKRGDEPGVHDLFVEKQQLTRMLNTMK
jgi:DNA primase